MSILGNRVLRVEDPRLLVGDATYVEDLELPGALHATFVRSPFGHARVLGIDSSAVEGAEVFSAAEVDIEPRHAQLPIVEQRMPQPVLARDVVRYVGEIVAIVVAATRRESVDAAELVLVDYEPLPAVVDPDDALRGDILLFPELETNVCAEWPAAEDGDPFADCEAVVTQRLASQRVASCPLEGQAAAASWEDDRLTVWLSTQAPHWARRDLAGALGLEEEQIRVIAPDVGGGFGPKGDTGAEYLLVGWLAHRLGRPVRWAESRSENMTAHGHGRAQLAEVTMGGSREGKVEAYRLRVLQDAGAYPRIGAFLPELTRVMASGVYAIPRVEYEATSVVTNTVPTVAYRGAGRPEAAQAIERAIDLFAAEIGVDPAEVRRKNFIAADAFPHTTPTGAVYDTGAYERALDLLLAEAGYEGLRAEQARRRAAGEARELGIGLSVYVEVTSPDMGAEWAGIEITEEGGALVRSGLSPHGQGHVTSLKMLVSDRLGLPFEAIEVVHGDTDLVPRGIGTFGSRSLQAGGSAVAGASTALLERARDLAASSLEANAADVVFDAARGRFHVGDVPEPSRSWAELAEEALDELSAEFEWAQPGPTWPFGAHLAVVEVDTETGLVELVRIVTVDDSGRILNPLIAEGQRHGGIAQGAAQALLEEFVYDEDGTPLTATFADYSVISAAELPSFELLSMETATPLNELGAKGIGESGTIGSTPAVVNAAVDALTSYGVRHLDMPLKPERVWRAIHRRG